MNNVYTIETVSCGPLGDADKILIEVSGFNLLSSGCTVNFVLINSTYSKNIATGWRKLEGVDFQNWGQDNTYVKNWLFNELNLSDPL